jgi:hypothetical protein
MDESRGNNHAGFTSMIHLHRIIGTILKIVNSVRNADAWRSTTDTEKKEELQSRVRQANESLQTWARDMVPPHIKTAKSGTLLARKHIALSSFFSAVMLLHRGFIRNPHRPSPLAGSQAQLKSAKAATDCIRGTAEFLQCVPKSHYVVFHGQYVFVAALILLSCIRWSDDPKFIYQALRDIEEAMRILQNLEKSWKGAKKCRATVEEYLEFTFNVLEGDKKCHFDCEHGHRHRDTRECKPAKRPLNDASSTQKPKKARVSGMTYQRGKPAMPDHLSRAPANSERRVSIPVTNVAVGSQVPFSPPLAPLNHASAVSEDTCLFDSTINNFLGAIDSSMDFQDQFDFSLDVGFNSSGPAFPSPDREQNSFF